MKTIVLFIILVAATGLVNAIQPSTKPTLNYRYSETIKRVSVKSSGNERLIKIRQFIDEQNTFKLRDNYKPPLGAPLIPTDVGDSLALVDLYVSTNGSSWTNKFFWLTGRVSQWYGITVTSGRVVIIDLPGNNLNGSFLSSIGNLNALNTLNLSGNQLTGEVPNNLGNLTELITLNLSNNQFSGSFPSTIGNLINLGEIYLSNNNFSGVFPSESGNIPYLVSLDLSSNQFTGPIPEELGALEYLYQLYINNNKFIFNDIEPIFGWSNYAGFSSDFNYSPQSYVGVADTIEVNSGDPFTISISGYIPGVNDAYQWYLNSELLSGEKNASLDVSTSSPSNEGNYNCEITNSLATDLTLYSNLVRIDIIGGNQKPVANAGPDQSALREGDLVTLDGSASSDGDSDPFTYYWYAPAGITLNNNAIVNPTFTVPLVNSDTTFKLVLVVYDDVDYSAPDTVAISVINNLIPIAVAGNNQTVEEGDLVQLSASGSYDDNSDPLTYKWSTPAGITLSDNTAINPTFTAPDVKNDTTYKIILIVNDDFEDSVPDTVSILVQNPAVPETLSVADTTIETGLSACFDALQTITVASVDHPVVFGSGSTVNLIAGLRINLMPGFHANSGSHTHAYISTQFCDPPGTIVMNRDEGTKSTELEPSVINGEKPLKEKMVKVYPNPNDGRFTIELSNFNAPVQLTIVNTLGVVVLNKTSIIGENPLLDISYLNRGLYFIKVKSSDFLQTKKIIIK